MVLTRGTIENGPDGVRNAPNTDTPFVDQSQTYTSHSSHQVFLREYVLNADGQPGRPPASSSAPPDGGMATWADDQGQAADVLGLQLVDADVGNIPMIATDPYGNFLPGPAAACRSTSPRPGLVEGDTADAGARAGATRYCIDTAFLNDIAHSAAPDDSNGSPKTADADLTAGGTPGHPGPGGHLRRRAARPALHLR